MAARIERARVIAVGTELTMGRTRDTNSGDLARDLSEHGVVVERISVVRDDLAALVGELRDGLEATDLVVTTGGLGPTPDDLTREAISEVLAERPAVDASLEAWLKDLFARRGLRMAQANRKQAWLIPSARPIANGNGTAPGWWVERPGQAVLVALPGPPGEMRPMWRGDVLRRLDEHGFGRPFAAVSLRLTGIGESAVAQLIGEELLRAADPSVATYAGRDSVEVRVTAVSRDLERAAADGALAATLAALEPLLAPYLFARDDETWVDVIGACLDGRTLATLEVGTGGSLVGQLGSATWLRRSEVRPELPAGGGEEKLQRAAAAAHVSGGTDVVLAVRALEGETDTEVELAMTDGSVVHTSTTVVFLTGEQSRQRAAVAACAALWRWLRPRTDGGSNGEAEPPGTDSRRSRWGPGLTTPRRCHR